MKTFHTFNRPKTTKKSSGRTPVKRPYNPDEYRILSSIKQKEWQASTINQIAKKYELSYHRVRYYVKKHNINTLSPPDKHHPNNDYSLITSDDVKNLTMSETAKKYNISFNALKAYSNRHKITFKATINKRKVLKKLKNLDSKVWQTHNAKEIAELICCDITKVRGYAYRNNIALKHISKAGRPPNSQDLDAQKKNIEQIIAQISQADWSTLYLGALVKKYGVSSYALKKYAQKNNIDFQSSPVGRPRKTTINLS